MQEREIISNNISTKIEMKDIKRLANDVKINVMKEAFGTLGKVSPKVAAKLAFGVFTTPLPRKNVMKGPFKNAISEKVLVGDQFIQTYIFGQGERILLAHGWQGQATDFHNYIEPLVASGYQVIAFDGPAHGSSDGRKTNMLEFAEVIAGLSERFDGFKAVIAHSFGGASTLYAIENFENMKCDKVINIGVPNRIEEVVDNFSNRLGLNSKVNQEMKGILKRIANRSVESLSSAEMLKNSKVDTLLVHDLKDTVVPFRHAMEVKENCPDVKILETVDLGHTRILRDKQVLKEIIDFIFKAA